MTRRQAQAVLSYMAGLLPHAAPASAVAELLAPKWAAHLELLDLDCEGDVDDLTTALEQLAATWTSARWPTPAEVSAQLHQHRSTRTRVSALAAARAAIANSPVPTIEPIATTPARRYR